MVAKSLKGLLLYMAHEEHDEKWVRVIELVPELQLLMLWQLDRHRMDAGKITMSRRKSGGSGGGGERTKPYNPSRSVPVPFKSYNGRTIQALLDGVLHAGIVRRCVRKANFTHRIEWQDGRVTTEELLPKDKTDKLEGTSSANAWSITAAAAPATRKRKREQEKAKKAKKSKQPKKPKKANKPDVPTNQSMRLVVNYKRYYGMSQGHGSMVVCKVQYRKSSYQSTKMGVPEHENGKNYHLIVVEQETAGSSSSTSSSSSSSSSTSSSPSSSSSLCDVSCKLQSNGEYCFYC